MRLTRLSDRLFQKMQTLPAIHPNNIASSYFFGTASIPRRLLTWSRPRKKLIHEDV